MTADNLNYQRLLSADQSLASEDLLICLIILNAQKDNHALSDKIQGTFSHCSYRTYQTLMQLFTMPVLYKTMRIK